MKITGLNDEQVRRSREMYGDNTLTEQKKETFLQKLIQNFGDPMIRILCVALLLNLFFVFLHYLAGIGDTEWYETVGIATAVLIATLVSTLSEYKNENAFRKLQQEASQIRCKVYRNGEIADLPIQEIVKGDKVLLQTGDKVPADGVVIQGCLHVDQAALNGESKEAEKKAISSPAADVKPDFLDGHSVFRGSVVSSGNAVMEAVTVGDKSVYGTIAKELQEEDRRDSPLKIKLSRLAGMISKFGYFGGAAIAVVYLIQAVFFGVGGAAAYFSAADLWVRLLQDLLQAVMFAVIIIVMAVPEGLPLMIAIVSSMNMKKMLKDHVLVRKVSGIETAGSLNILFSDKTGTITKGSLEAVLFMDGTGQESDSLSHLPEEQQNLLAAAVYHNTEAVITGKDHHRRILGGNPTDRAVLAFVMDAPQERYSRKVLASLPFNSTDKFSAITLEGASPVTQIKGAPERILPLCETCYDQNGRKIPFQQQILNEKIDRLAEKAVRVLALATADEPLEDGKLPGKGWTLIGIIGIRDEVRPESVTAIREIRESGVQVVMITGDRKETAVAIARDTGLLQRKEDLVFTSDELSQQSDEALKKVLPNIRVIARALPSDKSRLVRLSQELGLVVGMTGDGVNDSPALKKADVGFAMGSGTEVAKEAGDIVILDDNFHSICKAVLYGRTIFNNIRKFISFQLCINLSAVLICFLMPLLRLSNPLTITQILWVNLVMDTLAALAFGGEPALQRYMKEKPKRRDENIVSKPMRGQLAVVTVWVFLVSTFLLLSQLWEQSPLWQWIRNDRQLRKEHIFFPHLMTAYFCFFILIAVCNSMNVRSEKLRFWEHITENKMYFAIMGCILLIQVLMTYLGGEVFGCYGLNLTEWLVVILASLSVIPVDLLRKAITGRKRSSARKKG